MMIAALESSGLTGPAEDYLKAIYNLERDGIATNVRIAQHFGFAPASVTAMLRRLADHGLVHYERYRGVRLTKAGRAVALRTLRRHRVIETYLMQALGYPWDQVHAEAERLEHAASDELIDRMAHALGEPTVDPHGAPIPTREGTVDETVHRSLASLAVGERATVVRVGDENPEMLRYLEELGLRPAAEVRITGRAPFDGPISVEVGNEQRLVGSALAEHVLVQAKD